jgi:hypothetical protein
MNHVQSTVRRFAALVCSILMLGLPMPASAWKPYTHNTTAFDAYDDAVADGAVTIQGQSYPLRPEVLAALQAWPQYYNAGVIGPDGFPDLTMGQAIIHPEITGEWLQHILGRAWAAQSDPQFTATERQQILAFAYGFLTHGAGDMWGHSTVNDYAHGVFPGVGQILTSTDDASIAIRHLVVEGYIGDATPGFDGNPDRTDVGGGDLSDDNTPAIPYAVPKKFVYQTLIDPAASTPLPNRGPAIDFFLDLRGDLAAERDSLPGNVSDLAGAIALYDSAVQTLDDANTQFNTASQTLGLAQQVQSAVNDAKTRFQNNCDIVCVQTAFGTCILYFVDDAIQCADAVIDLQDLTSTLGGSIPGIPAATPSLSTLQNWFNSVVATATAMATSAANAVTNAASAVTDAAADVAAATQAVGNNQTLVYKAYLDEWVQDIDGGLMEWPAGVGLASTRGLFDAQTRRNFQTTECVLQCDPNFGGLGQGSLLCAACENSIGLVDVTLDQLDPFVSNWVPRMLGAPDIIVSLQNILGSFASQLGTLLANQTTPVLNPLLETQAEIQQFFRDWYLSVIRNVLGVDVAQLEEFLKSPNSFICLDGAPFNFPPPLGNNVVVPLYPPGEHDRVDALLGLGLDHHEDEVNIPQGCGRLHDDAETDFATTQPLHNTVMLAKLLLLDGAAMNDLLGDLTGRQISTYADGPTVPDNVMLRALFDTDLEVLGTPRTVDTWLRTIDGDHHWRADGRPRFCDKEDPACCASSGDPFCGVLEDQDPACYFLGQPCPRIEALNGGNGSFPIFESCVLRPAMRTLFDDWENPPASEFPDLGDAPSPDPLNDPNAPASTVSLISGNSFASGSDLFVGAPHVLELGATDSPANQAFGTSDIGLQRRVYPDGGAPGAFVDVAAGAGFSLSGPDGRYLVDHRSSDPCHTFDGSVGSPEATQTTAFVLDTTPAIVSCGFGGSFDSDDVVGVSFAVSDGAGSGVASATGTADGFTTPGGSAPAPNGGSLDLFYHYPGTRTVSVSHADHVGNAGGGGCAIQLHATSDSLWSNLARAESQGLVTPSLALTLRRSLARARAFHNLGQHSREWIELQAFVDLMARYAAQIDPATRARFAAFAQDLVSIGG